jgi:hypothetical protein
LQQSFVASTGRATVQFVQPVTQRQRIALINPERLLPFASSCSVFR